MAKQTSKRDVDKAFHPRLRRETARYLKKKRIVKDLWIVSGLLMVTMPVNIIAMLALGTTFLAFSILDETG